MFHLSEETIIAVYNRLNTGLNAFIDQANVELASPSFPLVHPVAVYDFIPTRGYLTDFPVVCVGDGTMSFKDDVGWSATAEIDLAVIVWVQEYDQRALAWKLRRYMTAIANCILEDRSLAFEGGGWGMKLNSIEPGPTLGRRDNPKEVTSFRAMTFTVNDEQDA